MPPGGRVRPITGILSYKSGMMRWLGKREDHARSIKLSTAFFSPVFSNAMAGLLPSIFITTP
jgi:hypothetical protein